MSSEPSWHSALRNLGNFITRIARKRQFLGFSSSGDRPPVERSAYTISPYYRPELLSRATKARDAMDDADISAPLPGETSTSDPREAVYAMLEELILCVEADLVGKGGKRIWRSFYELPETPQVYDKAFREAIAVAEADSKTRTSKRKPGRPSEYDPERDEKLARLWEKERYITYKEGARELRKRFPDITPKKLELTLGRVRKRRLKEQRKNDSP